LGIGCHLIHRHILKRRRFEFVFEFLFCLGIFFWIPPALSCLKILIFLSFFLLAMKKSHLNRARRAGLLVQVRSKSICFVDPVSGETTSLGKGSSECWHSERAFNSFLKRCERRNRLG
jgi:hypothetical protein